MRPIRFAFLILLAAGVVTLAGAAQAREYMVKLGPPFGGGLASQSQVASAAGKVEIRIACPENRKDWLAYKERGAAVFASRPITVESDRNVVNALIVRAAYMDWDQCPLGDLVWEAQIARISVYAPEEAGGTPRLIARVQGYELGGNDWTDKLDPIGAQRIAVERKQAADAQAAAQAAALARRQAVGAERYAKEQAETKRVTDTFWGWVKLILFLGFAGWAFTKRVEIARWYYRLKPHPATAQVDAAILGGQQLDGAAFAEMARTPAANDIEAEVRREQAKELAERWRAHAARLEAEEARLLEAELDAARREADRLRAESELLAAAVEHERAAARVSALKEKSSDG